MLSQSKKHFYQPIILFFCVLFFISCQKDSKNSSLTVPVNEVPDFGSKVNSSVSGFVTDENNAPVQSAQIKFGMSTTSTDQFGYFEIKNVDVVKIAAVVSVTKAGYFKGIKTYAATANKAAFFRIKLIPKINAGTISASAGGNVTLTNGLIIALPANAVVNATSNVAYTGAINVAASWIDPQSEDLTQIMPGDLRGIDNDGFLKGLTTYGMAAVELTGSGGELLQIASGKKATLTFPLSSLLASAAPASIPLWYFDENTGIWKEDGAATKNGNTYTGDVSHFSYWNCDVPNSIIPLSFTVVDNLGNPVANEYAVIKPAIPNSWSPIGGNTDAMGHSNTFVIPKADYILQVFGSCYGGAAIATQTFTSGTTAIDLGNIVIAAPYVATVNGTVTNCSSGPVSNGFIMLQNGYQLFRFPLTNGAYSFSTVLCPGSTNVNLIGIDAGSNQQSSALPTTLVGGVNSIANLQACGIATQEYINYSIDDTTRSLLAPDSFYLYNNTQVSPNWIEIEGSHYGSGAFDEVHIGFTQPGIAAGSTQQLTAFSHLSNYYSFNTAVDVHITEYGNVGEYVAGTINGTVLDNTAASHIISVNFRVRRTQ